ncbi:MAG TPA: hypothetical protein VNQ33_02350 [Acidimicrobiales bacterium]|nr:hypothetical protein [Acidimicrobiales bacterium]
MRSAAPHVVLLCDATRASGAGHLSRCVALGEAVIDTGGTATVAGRIDPAFARLTDGSGVDLDDLVSPWATPEGEAARLAVIQRQAPATVVVDSYDLRARLLAGLASVTRTVAIDDFARLDAYPCDVVVNFTVGASELSYPAGPELLLGPQWLLARRGLRRARAHRQETDAGAPVRRVLVAIGGVDRAGATARVVDVLLAADDELEIDVVAGRAFPGHDEVRSRLDRLGNRSGVTISAPSLAPHLTRADLVVCGGGLTKYEAAYLGVPTVVIDQTADQAWESDRFTARGLAVRAGRIDDPGGDLTEPIVGLLRDGEQRRALAAASRAAFPSDPTAAAARRILAR